MSHDPTIHRLDVSTPFAVGTVNAYLIDDDPLTLVDCGPAWTKSLHDLEAAIAACGRRLEDIELLLITHQHVDHLGLADTIVRRSGAELACLDVLAPLTMSFEKSVEDDDAAAAALMHRHGVATDIVEVLRAVTRVNRHWGASVHVDRELAHGSVLELRNHRLRIIHAPGHSPTDTLFVDEERGVILAGDHLLAHVSSNAQVASRPPGEPPRPRYPALRTYIESLRKTRELDVNVVLGGHGRSVLNHRALIDERIARYEVRAGQILGLISQRPRSAHEIARELWGQRAVTQAYLTTSEVLGHIDVLIDRKLVVEEGDGAVARFEIR